MNRAIGTAADEKLVDAIGMQVGEEGGDVLAEADVIRGVGDGR